MSVRLTRTRLVSDDTWSPIQSWWQLSLDGIRSRKKVVEIEQVIKCVGPIWGQHEAAEKVNKYMTEHNMHGQKWHWNGHWSSEDGTAYAEFVRLKY